MSSNLKTGKKSHAVHTTEKLLEDSDDDIEVVSKDIIAESTKKKDTFNKTADISNDEIVLDDSDSDIEELMQVPLTTKTHSTLDENRVKSILSKVASGKSSATRSPKLPLGLKITASNEKTLSSKASDSNPSTPRIVLQKVGAKWQNSSTSISLSPSPKLKSDLETKSKKYVESDHSNSNSDFVPGQSKGVKIKQIRTLEASDSEDSNETIPKLNRSTRSTRSSVNTSRSDISQDVTLDTSVELDDEIQEELAKLEALQKILSQTNPEEKSRSNSLPKIKKLKSSRKNPGVLKTPKVTSTENVRETLKLKPSVVPQIIERGPTDCFDDLIVETTAGFPCNYCESKDVFKKRREMIYHMQTKHEEELSMEQRNGDLSGLFPCEICKTAFYSKFILRTHRKAHVKRSEAGCDKYYQYYLRFGLA